MAKVKIEGLFPSLDGEYELDTSRFNGHELHIIKEISGVRANELTDAAVAGDYDLLTAFTVIALRRAGKTATADQLLEADVGVYTVDMEPEEADEEIPPASTPPAGNANEPGGASETNSATEDSGTGSRSGSGSPPSRPSLTGLPGSATSATSDPETLAS